MPRDFTVHKKVHVFSVYTENNVGHGIESILELSEFPFAFVLEIKKY